MIYIAVALKPEAQAFVDKYRPTKAIHGGFVIYEGGFFRLIISGIGVTNMKKALKTLIETYSPAKDDIFLNVGICAAGKKYKIGELIKVGSTEYEGKKCILSDKETLITCIMSEATTHEYDIVDMESLGFCEATCSFKNRYMYKVVSDHFEPKKVTKEGTKKLVFSVIDDIMAEVGI